MCLLCDDSGALRAAAEDAGYLVDFDKLVCPYGCGLDFKVGYKAGGRPPREGDYVFCPRCVNLVRLGPPGVLQQTAGIPEDWPPARKARFKHVEAMIRKHVEALAAERKAAS